MAKAPVPANMTAMRQTEIGDTGLRRYSGYVRQEFLSQLSGRRGAETYREMRDNDAVVGAVMYAIEQALRNVEWKVEPASDKPEAVEQAEFVEQCLYDMDRTWPELVTEILSFLTYGWDLQEIVYRYRKEAEGSRYNDGKVGWRKMPTRAQDSLLKWDFTPEGVPIGFYQQPPVGAGQRYIPCEKYILFRTTTARDNPEGRSILRNAYVSWYYKKQISNIEVIGIERDLAGTPIMTVPASLMSSNASDDQKALFNTLSEIVRNVKRNEDEGIILPSDVGQSGEKLYDLKLLSTGGNRQFDTNEIIGRYDLRMAQTTLADFILMGHEKVGSFALSSDKTDIFGMSLGGHIKLVETPMNEQAIPRLMRLNGIPQDLWPRLKGGDVEKQNLRDLGQFVRDTLSVGAMTADEDLQGILRRQIGLKEELGKVLPPPNVPAGGKTEGQPDDVDRKVRETLERSQVSPGGQMMLL